MYLAIPEESQQAILNAKKLERPLYQVERELLGFDSAKLSLKANVSGIGFHQEFF